MSVRPLIAIPARFSAGASALRYAAEVAARTLVEAVWRGGGEPFIMHPAEPARVAGRLARCDGVLLPGGGDLHPRHYGAASEHEALYDVDEEQDAFDLAVAAHALATGVPMLAICRGLQIVNVVRGGTLRQHMETDHRHVVHQVAAESGSLLAKTTGTHGLTLSCYHHQDIDRLAGGLAVTARAADGTIEAVELPDATGWFLGVQWHPEDTAANDPAQQSLFSALVRASAGADTHSHELGVA
ncbi:gamma-glutamyl-gamma-aminobutyrate hydrolase family protein [Actinomadura rudentiformis]|uniref:Gamma-glutamyl-gamma-aminobutyrate hydrolase family protein n=1 Tax=Actinomadura rudentiformis TaxID=359158 RepID=A0A6H9Z027_9ACTN|nr:gamma-glutamyl-gamma-aminobutyrate hydrolase family protein [Actinomadura rudentiformis]KAB2352490.1 gamma-glutamyl-gamma-aminobutyrate hydrolase family protein [Actinomadura rudentiformis]